MAEYVSDLYQPERFVSDDEDPAIDIQIQEPPEGSIMSATDSESEAEAETEYPDGGGADSDVRKSQPEEPRHESNLPSNGTQAHSKEMSIRI